MNFLKLYNLFTQNMFFGLLIFISILCCCETDNPNIIERKSWDLEKKSTKKNVYKYTVNINAVLTYIIIHHSAFVSKPGPALLLQYHLDQLKYSDIAYHFIIDSNGKVYEGRAIFYMGAHAGQTKEANQLADSIRLGISNLSIVEAKKLDPDYGSIGICLDGNFNYAEPAPKQLEALRKLLTYLISKYSINKDNILLHKEVKERLIESKGLTFIGKETVCPGSLAVKPIKRIISIVVENH